LVNLYNFYWIQIKLIFVCKDTLDYNIVYKLEISGDNWYIYFDLSFVFNNVAYIFIIFIT